MTTCDCAGCDEPTPWDLPSVRLDEHEYCSAECAREAYAAMPAGDHPVTITLHDPQYAVDRDELPPAVGDTDVNIECECWSADEAAAAFDDMLAMFPHEFRVA